MSQAASQASTFYKQVAKEMRVWTVRDDNGYPAPVTCSGLRAQPFWSSLARVEKIIKTVPAYSAFRPHEISWEDFTQKWVPGLTKDKLLVGVNWSGSGATGYDLQPIEVQRNVETERTRTTSLTQRASHAGHRQKMKSSVKCFVCSAVCAASAIVIFYYTLRISYFDLMGWLSAGLCSIAAFVILRLGFTLRKNE